MAARNENNMTSSALHASRMSFTRHRTPRCVRRNGNVQIATMAHRRNSGATNDNVNSTHSLNLERNADKSGDAWRTSKMTERNDIERVDASGPNAAPAIPSIVNWMQIALNAKVKDTIVPTSTAHVPLPTIHALVASSDQAAFHRISTRSSSPSPLLPFPEVFLLLLNINEDGRRSTPSCGAFFCTYA